MYPALLIVDVRPGVYDSDNVTGADNQQERLDSYIAGYVDGEGSFSVSVQRNSSCRVGFRARFECGRIRPNSKRDRALVLVVRNRDDLLERVIPFFERNPMLSAKQADFEKFASIVRELALGHHCTPAGFRRLLDVALSMNGAGRYRKVQWKELVAIQNPQRLHARQGREAWKIQSALHGDMQSQAEMTWPPSIARE